MERKKYLLIYLLLSLMYGNIYAKQYPCIDFIFYAHSITDTESGNMGNSYKSKIYEAFINGNMALWENTIKDMEESKESGYKDTSFYLELLNYYYGYTGYLISQKESKKASSYCSKGEIIIESLINNNESAELLAYKAAFIGFRISLKRLRAISLGPESILLSKQALAKDPLSYRALIERANVLYYSPFFAGGDKEEAVKLYIKAAEVMKEEGDTTRNWNYLSLLATVGQALQKEGENKEAELYYKMAIDVEPEFKWVKNQLLPSLK